MPAFAEVVPTYYDDVVEYTDDVVVGVDDDADVAATEKTAVVTPVVQSSRVNPRGTSVATGRTASRAVPSTAGTSTRSAAGRVTASRNATKSNVRARTATNAGVATRGTVSRAANQTSRAGAADQIATTRRAMQNTNSSTRARAGLVQTDTVTTPLYTGRVASRSSAVRARIPTVASTTGSATVVDTTAASTGPSIDELAQITDYCKAQYTSCMDNFCNVLDDNQGRCSCSKNIKNYAKTEEALKAATEALQDVAQQIQYIGLTGDEVNTLFAETEAEIALSDNKDSSQIKNSLDKIKKMIVEVKGGTASTTEVDSSIGIDLSGLLDFNISSTGFDLGSLFGTSNNSNTGSISNQRGEQLYKTAAARCKAAVLTDCQNQGVDISIITNSYDMEIDKQCIAYERSLTDANDEMSQTVRNAKSVLQRARLMVAQQKNAYDLRGCVTALDSCMQDDFVCGSDYENCLDPTGKYIVNGEIVVGSTPGQVLTEDATSEQLTAPKLQYATGLYATWNYGETGKSNAWVGTDTSLAQYINDSVSSNPQTETSENMAQYLLYKIGYNQDKKNYGMCISILNKCQDYTYEDGEYKPDNNVVKEYLQRTLTQIKSAQDTIVANYAESCTEEVKSCLTTNNYSSSNSNIAVNACKAQIVTCMSVVGNTAAEPTPSIMKEWVEAIYNTDNGGGLSYPVVLNLVSEDDITYSGTIQYTGAKLNLPGETSLDSMDYLDHGGSISDCEYYYTTTTGRVKAQGSIENNNAYIPANEKLTSKNLEIVCD